MSVSTKPRKPNAFKLLKVALDKTEKGDHVLAQMNSAPDTRRPLANILATSSNVIHVTCVGDPTPGGKALYVKVKRPEYRTFSQILRLTQGVIKVEELGL